MAHRIHRRRFLQLAGGAALAGTLRSAAETLPASDLRLWYERPAANWDEALPIGSGRLGAMIFGGVESDLLKLNEDTLCSEEPGTSDLPLNVTAQLKHIEELLKEGDYAAADDVITKRLTGRSWPCYQPMADLSLNFLHASGSPERYRRELDLNTAISRTEYTVGGVRYTRDYFASFPDQLIVVHLRASRAGSLRLRAGLSTVHPTGTVAKLSGSSLELRGQAPGFVLRRTLEWVERRGEQWKYPELWDGDGKRRAFAKQVLYGDEAGGRGMYFATRLQASVIGAGRVTANEKELVVEDAQEVVLRLSGATSYNGFLESPSRHGKDASASAGKYLATANRYTVGQLRTRHTDDYRGLFSRMSLVLGRGAADEASLRPTDQRIARFHEGRDPGFAALYLQFARYLTIAGSRPGSQALNLQGMWSQEVIPPWACGYTTNINLQMNYWPVDALNLSDCFEPLERLIQDAAKTGSVTAGSMYNRQGWVLHHNTTVWRGTQPVDNNAMPAFWPMGAGWLAEHLWEHYQFTGDRDFLLRAYPLLRGAAQFLNDWLTEDSDGHLLTPAGISPENLFRYTARDGSSKTAGVSPGPTMDMAIIRQVFRNSIAAAGELSVDHDFFAELTGRLGRLLPYRIGSRGQIQEWSVDFEETQPHHRHVSHLYGLYPDHQITSATPDLLAAAKRSLELRGDEGTGWSRAWKICLWARLLDGNHAYRLVDNLFSPAKTEASDSEKGGLMPNMFCSCPPMQIDGNFGGAAGIAELLVQSHEGYIRLLPALPDAWSEGSFSGMKTRNNCEVSAAWHKGSLSGAQFLSRIDQTIRVVYKERTVDLALKANERTYL